MAIDTITETVSNIPLLRKRDTVNPSSQSDKDDFVAKYEATNDHLANTTVTEINTVISQTNITIGQINTAVDTVVAKEALVNPHYTAIDAVYANEDNINAVNDNATNINAVASNSTNINSVNANKTNIDLVASNETIINNVSSNMAKITNLDTNMSDINNLDTNMSDIVLVSDAIQSGTLPTIINDSTISIISTWSSDKIDDEITTAIGGIDLSSKQDTLVSGTNIKTVNGESVLGAGDIALSGGIIPTNILNSKAITTSTTWTPTEDGEYFILAVGSGGSGACNTALYPMATGGGGGGSCMHKATLTTSDTLTITIGSGGSGVIASSSTPSVNGNSGGTTTISSSTGFTLSISGGGGGNYGFSDRISTLGGGTGGVATGGNIGNFTGGVGGTIYKIDSTFYVGDAVATGGGGVRFKSEDISRGGNITLGITANTNSYILTGGGGAGGRGGDFTRTGGTSSGFITYGGSTTPTFYTDIFQVTTTTYGQFIYNPFYLVNAYHTTYSTATQAFYNPISLIGGGLAGYSTSTSPHPVNTTNILSMFAGGGGAALTGTGNYTATYTQGVGGGSGGCCQHGGATYTRKSANGGNGIVYIIKVG